ncbi:hypothetical protein XU18_3476 [Perkinsela sp. CCAP 1560/4]|nr:hypothetical protein XU18_3476 [Perkinsela sp. CCAP 1560/4]|eukprot:KNH05505.1 hypothetical protein XU18_3476 [Perkinsela sp. CCAP 1560/4]
MIRIRISRRPCHSTLRSPGVPEHALRWSPNPPYPARTESRAPRDINSSGSATCQEKTRSFPHAGVQTNSVHRSTHFKLATEGPHFRVAVFWKGRPSFTERLKKLKSQ